MEIDRFYVLDCVIAPESNAITRADKHIHLEPKVMDCLVFFIQHSNEILSRDELIHHVWHDRVVNEEAVNRIIYKIRSAFLELGIEQELLVTHRKRGYQWTLHAEHAHQAAPPDIIEAVKTADNFRWLATLALGLCFAVLMAVALLWPDNNALDNDPDNRQIVGVSIDPQLPNDTASLADRLVESINLQGTLMAKTVPFNDDSQPLLLAFKKTVNTLIARDEITITLTYHGAIKWQYQMPLYQEPRQQYDQYPFLLEMLFQKIASVKSTDPCQWPDNIEAIEHYFSARSLLNRHGENALLQAIEHLNVALEQNPNFARAWSALGYAHDLHSDLNQRGQYHPARLNHQERATQAALKALSLCPESAEAILIAGDVPNEWKFNPLGQRYYRLQQALHLAPESATITHSAASFYWRMGYLASSTEWLKAAIKHDSWNGRIQADMAEYYLHLGRPIDAEAALLNAQEFGSDTFLNDRLSRFRIYLKLEDHNALKALVAKFSSPERAILESFIDWHQYRATSDHGALMSQLRDTLLHHPQRAAFIHKVALLAGDTELAVQAWLVDDSSLGNEFSLWWPGGGKLFDHPSFQAWLNDQGFIDFWRHTGTPDNCQFQGNVITCQH